VIIVAIDNNSVKTIKTVSLYHLFQGRFDLL